MPLKTFKHSGDLGDIIFSLPTIRALGGGVLYLDPTGGELEPLVKEPLKLKTHTKLTAAAIDSLKPFLLLHDYVEDVRYWAGEKVDCNLDEFRRTQGRVNLADAHLQTFGLPTSHRDSAWLKVDQPVEEKGFPIVINRTVRYICNHSVWETTLPAYHPHCLFVGTPKEHEIFEYTFGYPVRYYPTPTVLDLARVIAGCRQFMGNASLPHAIAEGLKKNKVLEVYPLLPNVIFERPGARYV